MVSLRIDLGSFVRGAFQIENRRLLNLFLYLIIFTSLQAVFLPIYQIRLKSTKLENSTEGNNDFDNSEVIMSIQKLEFITKYSSQLSSIISELKPAGNFKFLGTSSGDGKSTIESKTPAESGSLSESRSDKNAKSIEEPKKFGAIQSTEESEPQTQPIEETKPILEFKFKLIEESKPIKEPKSTGKLKQIVESGTVKDVAQIGDTNSFVESKPIIKSIPVVESKPIAKSKSLLKSNPILGLKPTKKSKPKMESKPTMESKLTMETKPTMESKPTIDSKLTTESKPTKKSQSITESQLTMESKPTKESNQTEEFKYAEESKPTKVSKPTAESKQTAVYTGIPEAKVLTELKIITEVGALKTVRETIKDNESIKESNVTPEFTPIVELNSTQEYGSNLKSSVVSQSQMNSTSISETSEKSSSLNLNDVKTKIQVPLGISGASKQKVVLLWTPFFGSHTPMKSIIDDNSDDGNNIHKTCKYSCIFTYNRNELNNSDAVLFHGRAGQTDKPNPGEEIAMYQDIPKTRQANQFYVFYLWENPLFTFVDLKKFSYFFNATMTYRRDSEIFTPIGRLVRLGVQERPPAIPNITKRSKLVAWIVSHCQTENRREKVVRELERYIHVNVYGKCGKLKCKSDRNKDINPIRNRRFHNPCFDEVAKTHKFYLAFENAFCTDYVTEKFWNALEAGMVPIVYGSAKYSLYAPKYSFIDVNDYASIRDLAKYLKYLDTNQDAYEKYFEWRKGFRVDTVSFLSAGLCKLCAKLTNGSLKPRPAIPDLKTWWHGKKGSACQSLLKFPNIQT